MSFNFFNSTTSFFSNSTNNVSSYLYNWVFNPAKTALAQVSFLSLVWNLAIWMKARTIYVVNNWIYTTNHRRIAVNYFWFVIFAGIVGMALATIIRLEMAYPGLGILAGDSLQYLSVVTAHAVVMVFFMIMPLMFGAFGNFLLPTQLGVHDVAFPRLNSAAFWFLPAGLIMLCQLVCLDRRYQRMNCYNIREIQSILRNKHFVDLVNTVDHRDFLNTVMVALRFKMNGEDITKSEMLLFFQLGVLNFNMNGRKQGWIFEDTAQINSHSFLAGESFLYKTTAFIDNLFSHFLNKYYWSNIPLFGDILSANSTRYNSASMFSLIEVSSLPLLNTWNLTSVFGSVSRSSLLLSEVPSRSLMGQKLSFQNSLHASFNTDLLIVQSISSFLKGVLHAPVHLWTNINEGSFFANLNLVVRFVFNAFNLVDFSNLMLNKMIASQTIFTSSFVATHPANEVTLSSNLNNTVGLDDKVFFSNEELTSNFRQQRFQTPVFKYNYKVGNYFGKSEKTLYSHMFTTQSELTGSVSKAGWFFNPLFSNLLKANIGLYFDFGSWAATTSDKEAIWATGAVRPTDGFYNFFALLADNSNFINRRWLAISVMDQKFYKMFATSSMQQRIYGNWRQLKFTREAWRCRLLSARHQKTLYKRYVSEEGLFWSVERNAKDVLPGWAMITPFAARTRFTAIGKVDIGLMGVFLVLNSSIVSSANFLVTYRYLSTLNNRKMRDARSFFTEGVMVASWMMIAANPMLAIGILMLLCDRHWQTSFFDYSGGGDTVLFQHMFWFFGHPEVYVIMIPAFGFNNTLLSFYLRKRVSARASLMYSMYTIAFLGFFVWGHHMYMVGLAHTTRMLFSTLTVMISVPAATKLMHWCVTLVNSSFWVELPFLFSLLFIFFFVSGGISGMAVAHTGMDILFHDSFYVIGHFHVMFAGAAMFASFGAFYFYFPSIFGVKFSRIWGYLHIIYFLLGQLMTVIPMFWLGYSGMPRRMLDYPASLGGWHAIVSAGHLLSVAGLMAFFIMIFDSLRQGRAATRNSFGVSRFNTRWNFYLYEVARIRFVQRKGWYISRYNQPESLSLNKLNYTNNEVLETTLYSYVLVKVQ